MSFENKKLFTILPKEELKKTLSTSNSVFRFKVNRSLIKPEINRYSRLLDSRKTKSQSLQKEKSYPLTETPTKKFELNKTAK